MFDFFFDEKIFFFFFSERKKEKEEIVKGVMTEERFSLKVEKFSELEPAYHSEKEKKVFAILDYQTKTIPRR
jgi:hypothetical protein